MKEALAGIVADFDRALARGGKPFTFSPKVREVGRVVRVVDQVVYVEGLSGVRAGELVSLPGGLSGIAASIRESRLGLILLGTTDELDVGAPSHRTGRPVDIAVGEGYLGRIVDALGRPLDGAGSIQAVIRREIEQQAPGILARAPVSTPLQTGIKSVDAAIPIGRGQRELILGDRQTGKTTVALETMLNQRDSGVICIYCAIGQRASAVARIIDTLRRHDALKRSIVVVAGGNDAPGLQYIAPFAATTIAEYFTERGRDTLVVYDDLTRHARAYRELSLLLRRPPGREAFPGDIFFLHARLLERATRLAEAKGGGSLTALPIIETQAQNLSDYIPTNLISITDGQIYLSPDLFQVGLLPAIDITMSVSRVGGDAQLPAYRAIVADLKLAYAQFVELEAFSRFGSRLDRETRRQLERGRRVREVLKQAEHDLVSVTEQIAILFAATTGLLDDVPIDEIARSEKAIRERVRLEGDRLKAHIVQGERIGREEREEIRRMIEQSLASAGLI
jgi:F-type H+-transporting ATPase subunit alpha